MSSARACFLLGVAFTLLLEPTAPTFAQGAPDFFRLFGGLINAAAIASAREQWQRRPASEYACLANRGISVDALASRGIAPFDPRVRELLVNCVAANPQPIEERSSSPIGASQQYLVAGITLGSHFNPNADPNRAFTCRNSEQFRGFVWCHSVRKERGKFGPQTSDVDVLSAPSGAAIYVNQSILPAYFASGDVEREIDRISRGFNLPPSVRRTSPKPGGPTGVLVTWGALTLANLDDEALDDLRQNREIQRGLLLDFLGSARRSATEGFPVYTTSGGPGYAWGIAIEADGKGALRLTALDPTALPDWHSAQPPQVSQQPPSNNEVSKEATPSTPDPRQTEKTIAGAKQLIEDASAFTKVNSTNPKVLDYVEQISGLNDAVSKNDIPDVEQRYTGLSTALNRDPDYQKFEQQLTEQRRQASAKYLVEAITLARRQKAFLLDYVSQNPASNNTSTFVAELKKLQPALANPELASLQDLTAAIDMEIRAANLHNEYEAYARSSEVLEKAKDSQDLSASTKTAEVDQHTSQTSLSWVDKNRTDKNRFMLDGDLGDVLFLYNATPKAPHVAKNLRGEFVWANDQAGLCLLGNSTANLSLIIKKQLAALRAKSLIGLNAPCNAQQLDTFDVAVTQRGAFLRLQPDEAFAILRKVETGEFHSLITVTAAQLKEAEQKEREGVAEISRDVAAGTREGDGIILLQTGSPNVCVIANDKIQGALHSLLAVEDKLAFDMQTTPTTVRTDAEAAFEKIQKAQCGAVYGSASDLKLLTEGLTKQNFSFVFSSIWVTRVDLDAAQASAEEENRLAELKAVERAQKYADQLRLEERRKADQSNTNAAKEGALRTQYDGVAKAEAYSIANYVKDWAMDQKGSAGLDYPQFATWLNGRVADHWTILNFEPELADYGTIQFKGRELETTFTRLKLRLSNRILGEYDDACFVFGRINDREFSVFREPVVSTCEDTNVLKTWQEGHQFNSRWFVNN